jgi:Ca2+/Na+ antiporter
MSPPLTYTPAYLGLFASLLLAVCCNAYLDIGYGGFAVETLLWGVLFGLTLWCGWSQHGKASEESRNWQKRVMWLGIFLFVFLFLYMWGMPRAGIYLLVFLQASNNCVTTTRRQLYLGLLAALVMAIFASAHYRADWTMLFYLVPFVIAVVFTLAAEQINRRAEEIRSLSLEQKMLGGQGAAIASATLSILILGGAFYAITPQTSWTHLSSRYGLPGAMGLVHEGESGQGGQGNNQEKEGGSSGGSGGASGGMEPARSQWPTPDEMRQAARRTGMPRWQSSSIMTMADVTEALQQQLAPIRQAFEDWWEAFKKWLQKNFAKVIGTLLMLMLLALATGLYLLLREARAGIWLRTRFDYWRYVVFGRHPPGHEGVRQFYGAVERLFALHGEPRPETRNTQEYLRRMGLVRPALRLELLAITLQFEDSRYGAKPPDPEQIQAMRERYRRIFRVLSE